MRHRKRYHSSSCVTLQLVSNQIYSTSHLYKRTNVSNVTPRTCFLFLHVILYVTLLRMVP